MTTVPPCAHSQAASEMFVLCCVRVCALFCHLREDTTENGEKKGEDGGKKKKEKKNRIKS